MTFRVNLIEIISYITENKCNILVLVGFCFICIVSSIIGGYIGNKGFRYTFGHLHNPMRIPLIALGMAVPLIVLWMQKSCGFVAKSMHIGVVYVCFIISFIVGRFKKK